MKKTGTKIRVYWVGVIIFTFIALIAYCATWIYVLEQENDQIEKQLIEMDKDKHARELADKDYFEIENND